VSGRDVDRRARRRLEQPRGEPVEVPAPRVTSPPSQEPVPDQLDLFAELPSMPQP
jgi:hypothetical protein